jgi:hypothetical protein
MGGLLWEARGVKWLIGVWMGVAVVAGCGGGDSVELEELRDRVAVLEQQLASTSTAVTAEPFDSTDWHSFYDWCVDHRETGGVDCADQTDHLQEWVNENPELKDCGLKAAKWFVPTTLNASRSTYYKMLNNCQEELENE